MAGEWREIRMGDCITINTSTYSPEEAWPFINYLETGNITDNRISDIQRLVPGIDKIPSRARRKVREGDIVYSTVRPNQRHFGMIKEVPDNLLVSTGFAVLQGKEGLACTDYVYRYLSQDCVVAYLHNIAEHSTSAYPSIKPGDIERISISLPPLPEQRVIAHILGSFEDRLQAKSGKSPGMRRILQHLISRMVSGEWSVPVAEAWLAQAESLIEPLDDKIELNRRMNETLEAIARALFKSWFVDFDPVRAKMAGRATGLPPEIAALFPDRLVASELGEIPAGWEASTLGDHVNIFDSKRIPLSRAEREKRQGIYPYHGAAGIMDHVNDYLFDGIYLLVGEDGSVSNERGLGITQYVWGKFWVNNHAHVIQGKSPVSTEHVYLHLHFEPVLPYVTGAVQPKLSQGRMKKIPFMYPGVPICAAFNQLLAPLFGKVRACNMEAQSLASLRDTLLPKLMSGELRVNDADAFLKRK